MNVSFKGKIPLRELVYRVLDLPPSMQPLVYDFGQLNTDTEKDYTHQIVSDHVRLRVDRCYTYDVYTACAIICEYFATGQVKKHPKLSQLHKGVIPAVARVLAWSQKYMRERKVHIRNISILN